jgi:hypothetical protein
MPAHPSLVAFYPVSVRQVVAVAPASFRPPLAVTPLPSRNGLIPYSVEDLHLRERAHARHTKESRTSDYGSSAC